MQSSVDVEAASPALAEMERKIEVGESFAAGMQMQDSMKSEVRSTVSRKMQHRGKSKIHRQASLDGVKSDELREHPESARGRKVSGAFNFAP